LVETRAREEEVRRRGFTVEEYHRMGEAGILRADERVELIEGEIIEMSPIGTRHAACVRMLTRSVGRSLGDELLLDVQNPVRLDGGLEPQPDLAVVRVRDYVDTLPGPEDVLLVIEVSDTTLAYDRNVKLPLYARANIREAWIVDLPGNAVARHNDPSEEGYRRMERVGPGRSLASEVLPNLTLQTNAVLG
jgi:Uma2 family endonuclease